MTQHTDGAGARLGQSHTGEKTRSLQEWHVS